jgi:hypothetical protein
MKNRTVVLSLLFSAIALVSFSFTTTAQQPCTGISSLADCPNTGCGQGDSNLNALKNRTDAAPPNIQTRRLGQIRAFSEPSSWTRGQDRSSLAFRESRGVVVKAFLSDARASGKETTNCRLTGQDNNDFHLDLVSFKKAGKETAVTAEITPRLRKAGWDFEKLDFLGEEKYYIRITGWYLLDSMHISNPIERSTNWEIHPITRLEVCTLTRPKCNQGQGWVDLENWEIP